MLDRPLGSRRHKGAAFGAHEKQIAYAKSKRRTKDGDGKNGRAQPFSPALFQYGSTRFGLRRQVPRLSECETKHKAFVEQAAALG